VPWIHPIVGLAGTSHVDYPEIRPSGSLRKNGKLHAQAHMEEGR